MSYLRNHKLLLLVVSVLLIANIGLLYFYVFKKPEHPAKMTHLSVAGTQLEVPSDLIRLSVGIEDAEDLIADLDRALA